MISVPRFRRFLRTDSTQATQNFTIGVILDAESDGTKIFWKLEHFTILRNKVRVQPIEDWLGWFSLNDSPTSDW